MEKATIAVGNARLLALADLLDSDSVQPFNFLTRRGFKMSRWYHDCGTPACALGHYSAMEEPRTRGWGYRNGDITSPGGDGQFVNDTRAEFAITYREFEELFSGGGCGGAYTNPRKAAAYIREFVAKRCKTPDINEE